MFLLLSWLSVSGCSRKSSEKFKLDVPRGYLSVLEIQRGDRVIRFGPFVGYYFYPENPGDFTSLHFICFNEKSFYTNDVPENARLFEGLAVLATLPDTGFEIPVKDRINPVFFKDAPQAWLDTRPKPEDEFIHFHSCHDAGGPVLTGYWLRHKALGKFTYDMGGRVNSESPLYHKVLPGIDKNFARIVEFDRGK